MSFFERLHVAWSILFPQRCLVCGVRWKFDGTQFRFTHTCPHPDDEAWRQRAIRNLQRRMAVYQGRSDADLGKGDA